MNIVIASNALPIAGVWCLTFMAIVAVILLPFFPLILKYRRKKAYTELHEKIEKARANILADGIVEGPKGHYKSRGTRSPGTESRTPTSGIPRVNSFHGGPWPR